MSQANTARCLPFRDPAVGDIIVRTSDDVDFHVHRRRLSDASPVFADMFSLSDHTADSETKPHVAVSETSAVWGKVLPFCYLAAEPTITLDDIPPLLEVGRKYQMVALTCRMRTYLFHPEFLDQKPFATYALACMAGVPRVALLAARRTLATPIYPEYTKEFVYVSGLAIYNLFEFRRRCGLAASGVVLVTNSNEVSEWMRSSPVLADMKTCGSASCVGAGQTVYIRANGMQFTKVRRSFVRYMERLHDALKLRPDSTLASAPDMLGPVIASALECRTCAATIYEDTTRCAKVLETKLEEAISKIELNVDA